MATSRPASIALNESETKFVSLLDAFASNQTPPIVCRIAGGWVRDKLLGLPSDDLDIALTTTSGHGFAVGFVDYLKTCDIPTTSVGKVAANPDQSKHLETGTTRILGLDCDFVGLRSETYTDSRIPSDVRLGTPLEDASRRDLTINSLFYNVHSREVEDHTGQGIADLDQKVARTPLPPHQTFYDDPLRVLRCVRFASRFDLTIASDISMAIKDTNIQAALRTKVSKERIGIEVTKMLQKRPFHALTVIDSLNLHSSIFTCNGLDPDRDDMLQAAAILDRIMPSFPPLESNLILWFGAALAPFRGLVCTGKKEVPAVSVVLAQGLKLSTEIKNSVTNLFAAADLLLPGLRERSILGARLQQSAVRPWRRTIVWAAVMAILPVWKSSGWSDESKAILQQYLHLQQYIIESGLDRDIDNAPLLNGHELQEILDIRPSPLMNVIRQAVNEWQLDNPSAGRIECEQWLRERWAGTGRAEWEAKCPKVDKGKAEKRKR